ncbi:hypothetical protein [Palleronia abyssalis]|uniref:DUF304 domain-containing protein n=1 Tax=Palleronia abyssalis TaxID=1501240 RepID=A0A2R8BQI2_9RHOB|nr:hypothetical protein [Palleronia abyssalis]SPJ22443.1 hypothetical protein PAA8504_00236 [Palleronia abyssalis]
MGVFQHLTDAFRAPKVRRMTQMPGLIVIGSGGPSGAMARVIEGGCLVGATAMVSGAGLIAVMLSGGGRALDPGMILSVGLCSFAGAAVLARIGYLGMRRETVIDSLDRELRQHRVTARGRVSVIRRIPMDGIESVFIKRGAEGVAAHLMARLPNGTCVEIGTAPPVVLERVHAQIVAAISHIPSPQVMPRRPNRAAHRNRDVVGA